MKTDEAIRMLQLYEKVETEIEIMKRNGEEIYRLSRMLPEEEGLKLMLVFQDTIKTVSDAWSKLNK